MKIQRKKAKTNIPIDNERIRVTEYSFNKGDETGFLRINGTMWLYRKLAVNC